MTVTGLQLERCKGSNICRVLQRSFSSAVLGGPAALQHRLIYGLAVGEDDEEMHLTLRLCLRLLHKARAGSVGHGAPCNTVPVLSGSHARQKHGCLRRCPA